MTKESELQSGRRWEAGGNVILLFWLTAALIWGLYGPKLQSLKGNKDERRRTMTVWGQMLTQCSSQPSELARLYFWPHHKSGWNSTQQVTSNLSEINTDFRSIRYSGFRNTTRHAQGSISYKLKTHIQTHTDMHATTMFYLKHLLCFHLEHEWTITSDVKCATCHSGAGR